MRTLAIFFVCFSVVVRSFSQDSSTLETNTTAPNLLLLSYENAEAKIESVLNSLKFVNATPPNSNYVNSLVGQLNNAKMDNQKKALAIWFLGRLPQTPESLQYLVANIDFHSDAADGRFGLARRWYEYPACETLQASQDPRVIEKIQSGLLEQTDPARRRLMCKVFVFAVSHKQKFDLQNGKSFALNQLVEASKLLKDVNQKNRLNLALKDIKELDFN